MPRNSTLPPLWATDGPYAAPGETWDATSRRVATSLAAFAAAGLTPEVPTEAQLFNEWLAQIAEFVREPIPYIFGNGTDGAVAIAGVTTLSDDMHATTVSVAAGGTLFTNGFRVFAQQSITVAVAGSILCDGANGSIGDVVLGGAGGASRPAGTLAATIAGGAGGDGLPPTALVGQDGNPSTTSLGGNGGAGGASVAIGGALSSANRPTAAQGRYSLVNGAIGFIGHLLQALSGRALDGSLFTGGASGGGGGGGADGGGGGGAGGGVMLLAAPTITNNGTIAARGGNGGPAGGIASGGGGGAGGGGAIIRIVREILAGAGTWPVTTGTPGAGTGPGLPGTTGTDGNLATFFI